MTEEKKELREQIAFYYRRTTSVAASYPIDRRVTSNEVGTRGTGASRGGTDMVPRSRRRVVMHPKNINQPLTWADRQARANMYRRPVRRQTHPLVKRTLAQTGEPASSGQLRAIPVRRRPQPLPNHSPIPHRGGNPKRSRRGVLGRVISFFVLLVIGVVGVNFALTSTTFEVQQVSIMGTQNLALVKSIQHMGIQGKNIFLIDTLALAAQIEMLPLAASATVERQWPNQVIVTVVERIPVLLWQTKHGTYSVDNQGVVMALASDTTGSDNLKTVADVTNNPGQPIHPGSGLNAADIAFALQVFARLPEMTGITSFMLRFDDTLYTKVIGVTGRPGFVVESPDGWVAYLGDAANPNPLENRLIELQQILVLAQKQQLRLATVDLRFGRRLVYTLKM